MRSSTTAQEHSLQLWFTRAGDLSKETAQEIKNQFSPSEDRRFLATKSNTKQNEYLVSRALMRHALTQCFPEQKNHWAFIQTPDSVPVIKNLPNNTFLSLTHSDRLICFAIATCQVGIDLEEKKQRKFPELTNEIMNEEELDYFSRLKDNQADFFYRCWCAKEACYKALSKKHQSTTRLKEISIFDLLNENKDWFLLEQELEGYALAVVSQHKLSACPDQFYWLNTAVNDS
ncbi:MAG: 4'-phosphopantetheinyl transferase superfamily protein [Pseudomonadales bacterium]|nr:4'-phosphopantetheinyl transferase superfamily protein [Pseudomonadales bacterium]